MFSYTAWSVSWPYFLAALAFGYALGSIPFGYLFARLAGVGDIRSIGSGNIGATNVLRTGRKSLAAATLIADAGKGVAAVLLAARWGPDTAALAGLGAFLGHLFPVWLGFRGGKGVATFLGVVGATVWQVAAVFAVVWLTVAGVTRYSSLAALIGAAATPLAAIAFDRWLAAGLFALLAVLIIIKHMGNIRRLVRGEESRIKL
ncbi:glycerol-3-phosphate 1-O-acyltransferase PlsY [Dichotomicrobium thermohalophilum]|uniref:Glycerol-3-phosphate acyltransferase n=1 Tax=Dichotomicrobium thermohalophilum TaxID=933063 RepID=A0A397PG37_9HYPH|nr:glycerol-3-phosphate 1-O-acyltransferase PlsY [Dichotomicrobium thermohalophilum]RIA47423.1 acyl-phosphate glycerol-3-phosphate acyltransferase [Dichotomicrobium thermohalophilum]